MLDKGLKYFDSSIGNTIYLMTTHTKEDIQVYHRYVFVPWAFQSNMKNSNFHNSTGYLNYKQRYIIVFAKCSTAPLSELLASIISVWTHISQLVRYSRLCGSYHDFLATNNEVTEPRVPNGKVGVITSKSLRPPPWLR